MKNEEIENYLLGLNLKVFGESKDSKTSKLTNPEVPECIKKRGEKAVQQFHEDVNDFKC